MKKYINSFPQKISKLMPSNTFILESNLQPISCLFFRKNKLKAKKKFSRKKRKKKEGSDGVVSGGLRKKLRKNKKSSVFLLSRTKNSSKRQNNDLKPLSKIFYF